MTRTETLRPHRTQWVLRALLPAPWRSGDKDVGLNVCLNVGTGSLWISSNGYQSLLLPRSVSLCSAFQTASLRPPHVELWTLTPPPRGADRGAEAGTPSSVHSAQEAR